VADEVDYKKTIRLPQTGFPMKANLAQREPEILARWESERVYESLLAARRDAPRFLFHDGPPYANGHLHYGHVLNKTLKDIVTKYQGLAGRLTRFVPGWDCHGLPIELNVQRALGPKHVSMPKSEIRAACAKEAEKWIEIQGREMRRLGAFSTWDNPYLTMHRHYERSIVEALAAFIRNGLLYRGKKPVYWCGSCRTALAEAEVEYENHTSPSIFVKFPIVGSDAAAARERFGLEGAAPLFAVIWTTTPWTLPANLAIAVHPEHEYVVVEVDGERWLLAKDMVPSVLSATRRQGSAVGKPLRGGELTGLSARHPFEDRASPLFTADYVTLEAGTGLVHTAPGHGADDYVLGRAHGLEPFAPVDDSARFTDEVRPEWRGKHVLDANPEIVHLLAEIGALANREGETVSHSYPHCWRCKNPVIFRATVQWFIALDEPMRAQADGRTLRATALAEIDAIAEGRDLPERTSGWTPAWGRDRIHGMIRQRADWCISRQRAWGVPIPALHCQSCGEVVLDEKLCLHIAEQFGRDGADAWFTKEAHELAPPGLVCPKCGGGAFDKDPNILDVWFESGASFWGVMRKGQYAEDLDLPADLYLEGSDQHRGWFHSSLLVGIAVLGRAPYKRVLTHGFVADEQGRPYSKSDIRRRREAGEKIEYVEPDDIIKQSGAETLRLWAAYEDYRNDPRFSREHLKQVSEAYFKIRNTLRFVLGNLHDYEVGTDGDPVDPLDRWARARLRKYQNEVVRAYETFDFRAVCHRTVELCTGDWSAFYLDVVKDRLYCDPAASPRRRSCQATLHAIARTTIAALAPILSFTAEEAWRYLPGESQHSVFLAGSLGPVGAEGDEALLAAGHLLASVRELVNQSLEPQVKAKQIGHRREAVAKITATPTQIAELGHVAADLAEALAIAEVEIAPGERLSAAVTKSDGTQCPRCWRFRRDIAAEPAYPMLCLRCAQALAATERG
jgi:isoleucyl-tRNA synthetase